MGKNAHMVLKGDKMAQRLCMSVNSTFMLFQINMDIIVLW